MIHYANEMYDSMLRVGVPDVNMRACALCPCGPLALREYPFLLFIAHMYKEYSTRVRYEWLWVWRVGKPD